MTTTATRSTKRRSTKRRPGGDAATRAEQTAQLHATLTAAVEQLHQTDNWTNYLEFLRSFHRYSIRNVMLIMSQRPNATAVAGFRAWQEKGRQVRKGEKAIKIFGYSSRKVTETDDQGTETEKKVPIFPILSVFDISQTDPIEGHPLAGATTAPETPRLTGDDTTGIYDRLVQVLEARGWTIIRGETRHHAIDGTTTWGKDGTRTVTVRTDFDDAHAILTLIHEAAHVLMHDPDDAQNRADSVQAATQGFVGRTQRTFTETQETVKRTFASKGGSQGVRPAGSTSAQDVLSERWQPLAVAAAAGTAFLVFLRKLLK